MIIDQPISVHISVSSAAEAMWEHQVADFMARLDTPAEAGGWSRRLISRQSAFKHAR